MRKYNIAIADDHILFRKGLISVLNTFQGINNIYEADNGQKLLSLLKNKEVDVVLMDLKMPGMDGVEASKRIIANYPNVKILVITMYDEDKFIKYLMELGVHGYLLKNSDPGELEKAIYSVIKKDFYYNQRIAHVLRNEMLKYIDHEKSLFENTELTNREIQILKLICIEYSNKDIAEKLNISVRTVEKLRSNMIKKLNVKNTAGLVKYAVDRKIIV